MNNTKKIYVESGTNIDSQTSLVKSAAAFITAIDSLILLQTQKKKSNDNPATIHNVYANPNNKFFLSDLNYELLQFGLYYLLRKYNIK